MNMREREREREREKGIDMRGKRDVCNVYVCVNLITQNSIIIS